MLAGGFVLVHTSTRPWHPCGCLLKIPRGQPLAGSIPAPSIVPHRGMIVVQRFTLSTITCPEPVNSKSHATFPAIAASYPLNDSNMSLAGGCDARPDPADSDD